MDALKQTGYEEGKNLTIQYRWAEGNFERLAPYAADLVNGRVALIASTGGPAAARAAKQATASIPIVFVTGGDPVA